MLIFSYVCISNSEGITKFLMKTFLLFGALAIVFLPSCSSHKYTASERRENQTFSFSTNAPNTSVRIAESTSNLNQSLISNASGTRGTILLPSMKKSNLTLVVSAPDYATQEIRLRRKPRAEAFFKMVGLGLVTYFIPVLIDPFRSDFYELRPASQNIDITMTHSVDYFRRKLDERRGSTNPSDFIEYIRTYPNSPFLDEAIKLRDELEFSRAVKEGTEAALDRFIASHSSSHVLPQAQKAKSNMEEARLAFESAKSENTVKAYAAFLVKFPLSIHTQDALHRKTRAAFEELVLKPDASRDEVTSFITIHLSSTAFSMDRAWVDDAIETSTKQLIAILEKSASEGVIGKASILSGLVEYEDVCGRALKRNLSGNGEFNLSTKPYRDNLESEVLRYYYGFGSKNQTQMGWERAVSELSNSFPSICSDSSHFCLLRLIESETKKNGDLIISNAPWVFAFFNEMWEGDRLISFRQFEINSKQASLADHSDWIRLNYVNNNLREFETKKNGVTTCLLRFKGESNRDTDIVQAEYFSNGTVVYRQGVDPSGKWFTHVIKDGVNVTLEQNPLFLAAKLAISPGTAAERTLESLGAAEKSLAAFKLSVPDYESGILNEIEMLKQKLATAKVSLEAEILKKAKEEEERLRREREAIERQQQAEQAALKAQEERAQREFNSKAKSLSVNYVAGRLRSPSSAVLVEYLEPVSARKKLEDAGFSLESCQHVTRVAVDAQNGFGVVVRGIYYVFFRNGQPCHVEEADSLIEVARSGYSASSILSASLRMNGCDCE
jgi:hypothetical protein